MRRSRRRGGAGNESLELLLDTICNTFGGVLFIAILLALSVRPEPTSRAEDAGRRLASAAAETALAEVSELEALLRQQAELAEAMGVAAIESAREGVAAGASDLADATDAAEGRQAAGDAQAAAADKTRRDLAELDESLAEAARRREAAEDARLEAEQELEDAFRSREQSLSMPRLGGFVRDEVCFVLQFNRLYQVHRYVGGERAGMNPRDMRVAGTDGQWTKVKVRPSAGVDLTGPRAAGDLSAVLRPFRGGRYSAVLVVRSDSFGGYRAARDAVKRAGLRFRIFVGPERIYDRGGRGGRTQ